MMRAIRSFAAPAYTLAFLLVLLPLVDVILGLPSIRADQASWRFGVAGLAMRAFTMPLVGVLFAGLIAALFEHGAMLRTVAVVASLLLLGLLAWAPLFVLDALEMRTLVTPPQMRNFMVASLLTIAKMGAFLILLALIARASWKAGGPLRKARRAKAAADTRPVLRKAE